MKVNKDAATRPRRRPPPRPGRGRLPRARTHQPEELAAQAKEVLAPRERLSAVAKGHGLLRQQDVEAVLTDMILAADQQSRSLSRRCVALVDMVFDAESRKIMDPSAAMDLLVKLDRVQRSHLADARRGIELLSKITRPHRPMVQVVASTSQLNVAAAQQLVGAVDLGEGGEKC